MLTSFFHYLHQLNSASTKDFSVKVDMDKANAIESTPLIAQYDNNLPHDEKQSTIARTSNPEKPDGDEPFKDKTHLTIFLTALLAGILGYVLFMLFHPLLTRLIFFLLSFMWSSKAMDDGDGGDAVNPLSFGFMMFFG